MKEVVASRRLLSLISGEFKLVDICIANLRFISEENYKCDVIFSLIAKYNTNIKGIDEINSLENAINYVNKICTESEDPLFFWEDGEKFSIGG